MLLIYLWNKDIKNCAVLKANHRHRQKILDKVFLISLVTAYGIFLMVFIEFDNFFGRMYYCIYLKVKGVCYTIRQKIQIKIRESNNQIYCGNNQVVGEIV